MDFQAKTFSEKVSRPRRGETIPPHKDAMAGRVFRAYGLQDSNSALEPSPVRQLFGRGEIKRRPPNITHL
jgi:hypothetical protein